MAPVRTSNIWIVDAGVPRPIRVLSGWMDIALNKSSASDERKCGEQCDGSGEDGRRWKETEAQTADVLGSRDRPM